MTDECPDRGVLDTVSHDAIEFGVADTVLNAGGYDLSVEPVEFGAECVESSGSLIGKCEYLISQLAQVNSCRWLVLGA